MTSEFKDLFISYGRRESLVFVGRLHQQLKLAGYDAWFDKVNIPDGDDYAQRINHGIESAHNFVYVMAPRCMTSPYCLIELEYARLLGKRVIPINQMVIFETPSQELSDGDKQVMVSFYKHHNQPDQNIHTTQEVLARSHALIGRTDWLDAKKKVSDEDCQRLAKWAQPYENHWAKHDDLDYLKSFEFPIFGETIDTLSSVVERLVAVLERQTDYVHKHTEILFEALLWQQNQKATHYLLVGKERTAAEEWLLTEFLPPKQPPCKPPALVCEFICEARKNAENLMTDIFICYDIHHDKAIRDNVVQSLSRYAKTTWTHDRDIQKGYDYEFAIEQGIENADNFFYFISPHAVVSEYCQRELEHALKYNKRIVPLLIVPTTEAEMPEVLRGLQYVDFTDNTFQADYDSDIDDILNILRHDQKYYEQHKVLLARALKWQAENHKPSFLLRGHNLDNAKTWWRLNEKREPHPPLALHKRLITSSNAAKGQLGTEVFISYSRKDGDFARQLNIALQEAGKTTWFDQESISTGVDFEKEIFKGIASADNFLFILSADAVESEYCENEVNYAASLGKRFITVLHRETDPNTMPDALRIIQWLDFSTEFEIAFLELVRALEQQKAFVHQHTEILTHALHWQKNQKASQHLLVGEERLNAEEWLLTKFRPPEKNPCQPSALMCEFICESRKNAENRMTDIFVCCDMPDKAIRNSVIQSLSGYAKTCWMHDRDIQKGTRYEYAIEQGIEGADNFFFSPTVSNDCQRELTHALKYHKRIIPLLITPTSEIPDALRGLQYIDFTIADYDSKIDEILNLLAYEQDYYQQHKILLVRSRKWAAENRKPTFLLRSRKLELAKTWLRLNEKRPQHSPLPLHQELITASDTAIHQRGTELFISYSRKDNDFVQKLITQLQETGKTVWFDQETQQSSINGEVDFEKETFKGIDNADNFVFVMSPPSVASPYCKNEVNHAASQGKRIIMLLHRKVEQDALPDALRVAQRVDFSDSTEFETAFLELVRTLERQKAYIHQHSEVLIHAQHWQQNQKATQHLLVGQERTAAEQWLLTKFLPPNQPPCQLTPLMCEFICEARKNAENLTTDIFICYEERDKTIRDSVVQSLSRYAKTCWTHDHDIQKGKKYDRAIERGIEGADNFFFFISPSSVASKYCQHELAQALKYHKRVVPLLIIPTPISDIQDQLRSLQYVDFTDNTCQADYDSNIDDILNILRRDQEYYEQHKILLARALKWQAENHKPAFLLRGHNLDNAKTWWRLNETREQHPPLALHKQLITSSEAAKGQLGTEVFIYYSRKDGDFARQLNIALQEAGKTTWFDQESISTGVDFEKEIFKGIVSSDNLVFVISPDAVTSDYCKREVNYASEKNKRFISVLHRETAPTTMPKALRVINWIDFANTTFDKSFLELVQAVELDREHAHQHTVLQQRASDWTENDRSKDFLLNITACKNAEIWRNTALAENKPPAPTQLQQDFIQQSRKAIKATKRKEQRRQRMILSSVIGGMAFTIILAIFSFFQMEEAKKQKDGALRTQSLLLGDLVRQENAKGNAANGILLALEALPKNMSQPDKPYVAQAERQLYQAVSELREHATLTGSQRSTLDHIALSPDGQRLVTASKRKIARLWDVKTHQQIAVLLGHQDRVWFAEFSPDGKKVVTASKDKTARIWDASTGEPLHILHGHQGNIWSAKFSPDGNQVVTASEDMTARLWDANTGQQLAVFIGHKGIIKYAEFSPDGQHIVTASEDKTAGLWDTTGGLISMFAGHRGSIWYAIFSPDGKHVITASGDKTARLWDVRSGELLHILSGHEDVVFQITVSPDQQRVATVSYDKTVRLWDINSGKQLKVLQHKDKVRSANFSPDGQQIVTTSDDKTARLWNSNTGKQVAVLSGHIGTLRDARFVMDGQQIITIGDETIRFWNINPLKPLVVLSGHTDTIDHSIFSHDGQQVVTASEDSTIRIWDANTGKQLNILNGHEDFVTYIELSPNGQRLLSVSEDNTARLWDINTGQQLVVLEGHKERLRHATFSADGLTVVTASDDKTARLWDANTGQQRLVLHGHTKEVVRVAFSPDNQYVATASWDKTAKIWDAYTGKLLFTLDHKYKVEKVTFSPDGPQLLTVSIDWKWQGMASLWNAKNGQQLNMFPHTKAVLHADFSPDGTQVITGSKDNTARLWNTIKRQQIPTTLTGHRDDVYDATFSPDGKKVMTVSLDHTARLWDTESGQQLAVMSGHTDEIYQAAFSPDGKKVVTSSVDETARVWRIFATTQELIDYANHVVPRCLTQAQRDEFFLSPNKSHALIEAGEKLAQAGKIEAAVVKFQQALQQAPCLKLEPINQAQQIATHSLMKQGHELIKQEQIEAALAKFNRVREINPHLNFEPLNLVRKITALTLMDKSTQLAQQGKVKAAVAGFQTALRIDSNLNFDPEKKAQQIVANVRINKGAKLVQQGDLIMVKDAFQMALTGEMNSSVDSKFQRIRANYLLRTGTELAQRGDIEKAIAIYKEIPQSVSISAYFWNRLCWYGSLHQKAFEVMDLCAKAVELEPENEWFRRVRGINSALISDSQAAIEDFQFLVAKTPYNDLNQQVRKWIRTLRRGKNPFTPTVQKLLLLHGTTSKQPPKWCAGELNNAEQVICHNEKLWNLEDQSHNSYYRWHDSLPNLEDRDRATKELYNWLEHRNAQCSRSIKFCLQVYEERVKLLNLRHRNETWEEKNYSEF